MTRRLLSTVEHVLVLAKRGVVVFPGIPPDGDWRFKIGDPLIVRRPDGSEIATSIAGIETGVRSKTPIIPILLAPDVDPSWPEKIRRAVPGVLVKAFADPKDAVEDIVDADATALGEELAERGEDLLGTANGDLFGRGAGEPRHRRHGFRSSGDRSLPNRRPSPLAARYFIRR